MITRRFIVILILVVVVVVSGRKRKGKKGIGKMFKEEYWARKTVGVILIFIEMNLLGGTIFGIPSLFPILARQGIYRHRCPPNATTCAEQIQEYQVLISLLVSLLITDHRLSRLQNALTLGIAFFDLPSFFVGILIDRFGSRFVKLISM